MSKIKGAVTTHSLDTLGGVQGLISKRGRGSDVQKRFTEKQNQIAMEKARGIAGYIFGREGTRMDFGEFAQKMMEVGAGKGTQTEEFRAFMARSPDLEQFLDVAMTREGGFNVEGLRRYFGDDLTQALEKVTGMAAKDIETALASPGEANKLFDKATVTGLFRQVLGGQNIESIPIGSQMKPNYMRFAEGEIKPLAKAIGDAVAKAIKGES